MLLEEPADIFEVPDVAAARPPEAVRAWPTPAGTGKQVAAAVAGAQSFPCGRLAAPSASCEGAAGNGAYLPGVQAAQPCPEPAAHGREAAEAPRLETRADKLERYRRKKARRNFHQTIRYQTRKVHADIRPRIKGRFVKPAELEAWAAQAQA